MDVQRHTQLSPKGKNWQPERKPNRERISKDLVEGYTLYEVFLCAKNFENTSNTREKQVLENP